jgi:aspartyl-tRNA(Asn)/glutamyl-tRNA(Gln) amidotransferase subunit A
MAQKSTTDLALLPAHKLAKLFRRGKASPVEALQAVLARIAKHNATINAFQHLDAEAGLKAARQSEKRWHKGKPLSAIDGVPTTVKDTLWTIGMPTVFGTKANDPAGPWTEDAPASAALRAAGAVIFAKTTTPEYGFKGVTDSPLYGITRNPWNMEMTPGGSSGGSAASLAAGMGTLSVGTDAAGSVRIPSAFTGLATIKATFARVPVYPPSAQMTLSNVGPMARDVTDVAAMMNVITRPDPREWWSLPDDGMDYVAALKGSLKGLKVAYSPQLGLFKDVHPEVAAQVAKAAKTFARLGAKVSEVDPKIPDPREALDILWMGHSASLLDRFVPEKQALMDPGLIKAARIGAAQTQAQYIKANQLRLELGVALNLFFTKYDLLLTPTMPVPAFKVGLNTPKGGDDVSLSWTPFTLTFNMSRHPAASVPCGLTKSGLPVGLQNVGAHYKDALVLRAAKAFEDEVGTFAPPMAS